VMEGGYGTMSADREKVVSTLVIEKCKQSVTHSPSRSLDLNYRVRKM